MGEPRKQHQPIDLLEFKRRLQARVDPSPAPIEDPLAELARIVGGEGRIVPADANPLGEASSGRRTPIGAPVAIPLKTDLEPVQRSEPPVERQSPPAVVVDPPFDDIELGSVAREEWRGDGDQTLYGNENLPLAADDHAHLRLRKPKRHRSPLYVTTAAIVMAGLLAVFLVRREGSAGPPPDHPARNAALAKISPADANSPPAAGTDRSAVAVAQADVAGGAQLSSTPGPVPDSGAAESAAAAPASSAPPAQDDSQFPPPRIVHTIPVYGDGTVGEPAANATEDGQNSSAPGLSLARVVEAQTLQPPASAANNPSAGDGGSPTNNRSAVDGGGPTNGANSDVASVGPAKVASAPPAKAPVAAAGAAYAAVLASRPTESEARGMLGELLRKYQAVLGGHRLTYHRTKGANGTVYEIRVAGLSNEEARALCDKLSSAGGSCRVKLR